MVGWIENARLPYYALFFLCVFYVFLCVFDITEMRVFFGVFLLCFATFGNGKSISHRNIACHMFRAHGIHVFDIRKK